MLITKSEIDESLLNYLQKQKKIDYSYSNKKNEYEINFLNYTGFFNDKLIIQPKLKEVLELDEENLINSYKVKFDKIYKNIIEYLSTNLLFDVSIVNFNIKEANLNSNEIYQLFILLNQKDVLIESLYLILNNPHRKLIEKEVYKNFDEVDYIDENILIDILQNPKSWSDNNPKTPNIILQYQNYETFNTIENQFIKYFLIEVENLILKLIERFEFLSENFNNILNEIENFLSDEAFRDIDELNYFPSNSQLLLKRDGYREIFNIYRLLHSSFIPSFYNDLNLAFDLKDFATICEYYLLVEMIKEFKKESGEIKKFKLDENLKIYNTIYEKAYIEFENGLKLYYQKTFTIYSFLKFRPDFYIEFEDKRVIFDAKFRVFKKNRKDILKNMHYYRDSLKANSVVALTLGKKRRGKVFEVDKSILKIESFNDIFDLNGVGYLDLSL